MNIKLIDENLVGQPGLCPFLTPPTRWERDPASHDVAIYTDRLAYTSQLDDTKSNYAWIIEPPIVNGENYVNIAKESRRFKRIFTYMRSMANQADNVTFIPHGGTWLRPEDINIHIKSKLVSMTFSDKQWNSYHRLRHRAYNMLKEAPNVSFFGSGCGNRIPFKIDGLRDFAFAIVMENSVEESYFTEKIIDCFLTGTVPIYMGCPSINQFFDGNGIITFTDVDQLPGILNSLSMEQYATMSKSVLSNFHSALAYVFPELAIHQCILQLETSS